MTKKEFVFTKDTDNKKLTITRAFDASLNDVWSAWTEAEILDKWWAPKPYRAETKTMNFAVGGSRLYAMVSPDDVKHWCKETYTAIEFQKLVNNTAVFCDEQGNNNQEMPTMFWKKEFRQTDAETTVLAEITFTSLSDMEMIIKMGFQEGFTAGLKNLEDYLEA